MPNTWLLCEQEQGRHCIQERKKVFFLNDSIQKCNLTKNADREDKQRVKLTS